MTEPKKILSVNDLKTFFFTKAGTIKAVDGVSFSIDHGQIIGLVGESGSGKSVTGLSVIKLVDDPGEIVSGKIIFCDQDLTNLSDEEMRKIRGSQISMIFQDAMMSLNPLLRIDTQLIETLKAHKKISYRKALEKSITALAEVGIPSPIKRIKTYPHQFSGGMRQRVAIAISMLNEPKLIIADEATTALDVTIQSQILYETQKLCREKGTGLIWITHDLTVLAGLAEYICVMYAGKIVEQGEANEILDKPHHPYTVGLIASVPSKNIRGKPLYQIPGMTPSLLDLPNGCSFYDRCERANHKCLKQPEYKEIFKNHFVRCHYPYFEKYS